MPDWKSVNGLMDKKLAIWYHLASRYERQHEGMSVWGMVERALLLVNSEVRKGGERGEEESIEGRGGR